jgi:arylsulfatase A-like enzyme
MTLGAAAKRALVGTAVVATYVNLTLCLLYFWQEVITVVGNDLWELGLLGALPAALVTAAVVFITHRLRRRYATFRKALSYASYVLLAAGAVIGVASLSYQQYRMLSRPHPGNLPDVVVITLDAWRADELRPNLTPEILSYAEQNGVIFTEARAASSWTLPSFAASLTGSNNITDARAMEPAGSNRTAWAEVMRHNGYDTYAVLSNRHLEIVRRLWRGFDHFDYVDFRSPWGEIGFYDTALHFGKRGRSMEAEVPGETTRRLVGRTLDILRRPSSRPKFIWVHILDPHFPYQPLKEVLEADAPELLDKGRFGVNRTLLKRKNVEIFKGLYEYELKSTDLLLAELLRELATRPHTLVVISSDHGEEFFEHGKTRHGTTVYDEVCRVPLIIALPKGSRERFPAGESAIPVSQVDVAPSVLSYLGLEVPASMDGRRDLLAPSGPGAGPIYVTLNQIGVFRAAIVEGGKKVIVTIRDDGVTFQYFDLTSDPGELRPLPLDAEGEVLKNRLTAWIERQGVPGEISGKAPALFGGREELRALGYM